jgi:hypothetical protein
VFPSELPGAAGPGATGVPPMLVPPEEPRPVPPGEPTPPEPAAPELPAAPPDAPPAPPPAPPPPPLPCATASDPPANRSMAATAFRRRRDFIGNSATTATLRLRRTSAGANGSSTDRAASGSRTSGGMVVRGAAQLRDRDGVARRSQSRRRRSGSARPGTPAKGLCRRRGSIRPDCANRREHGSHPAPTPATPSAAKRCGYRSTPPLPAGRRSANRTPADHA